MMVNLKGKGVLLGLMVAALLLAPSLAQAKGVGWESYKKCKENIIRELKLSPDKATEFRQLDEKYETDRKGIYANLKKNEAELKQAMATAEPDEVKVQSLVNIIMGEQNKLMDSFKSQRNAEMALLTPLQQGHYLVSMEKWRHEMMQKYKASTGEK